MKRALLVFLGAALLAWSPARPARACGGFFCNRPAADGTLPIAQAAENVLFVMDQDPDTGGRRVQAHIQILYTGPASEFSWIVPVTAVPTVTVGADILFDRIEPPTRPSFQFTFQMEGNCRSSGVGAGCGSASGAASNSQGFGGVADGGTAPVDVISHGSTGPYDYVVVSAQDGATLRTWLTTNNYYVSPEAAQIVDNYVTGQFSFVALKLRVGQDTSAIRPIVLTMAAPEACLPLKLTAIAATPDLRINVWVLADARAVPMNYAEISLNLAKLDWFSNGRNYDQLLKDAANEAQGNAFAVEYAMPATNSVPWFALPASARSNLTSATTPPTFVSAVAALGLPLTGAVLQLLRKYIPIPAPVAARGVTEGSFYSNTSYYWSTDMTSFAPFDPVAAAAEFDTEILTPMSSYRSAFDRSGRLTRLATFISPEEMTSDPLFVTNPSLPDVSPKHMAIAHVMCGDSGEPCAAPVRLQLEDGREVNYRATGCMQYDRGDLDQLPAADVAWQRDAQGEGQVVVDNRAAIMTAVKAHNDAVPTPGGGSGCACNLSGSSGMAVLLLAFAGIALSVRRHSRRR